MNYREEMKQLRDTLNAHGYRYYVLDDPTISDYEYDRMLRQLEDLEKECSLARIRLTLVQHDPSAAAVAGGHSAPTAHFRTGQQT